jgi:hypothetical protein
MSKPVQQTPKEWYSCLEAGAAAIRRPYNVGRLPRRGLPCVVVYHLPSFIDCCAWSLVPKRASFNLQRLIWRQSVDARRLSDPLEGVRLGILPEPTLEEHFEPADSAWCTSQLHKLASIRCRPFVPEGSIGLDGEMFGVHIPHQVDLEWWCSGPSDWRELISWTHEFIAHFQSPERGGPNAAGHQPSRRSVA